MEASAAASAASELLSSARYSLAKKKPVFAERDVAGEEPRVGVFVCSCGVNIASVVDVTAVRDYAETLPYVEFVENNLFTCSQDTQGLIKDGSRSTISTAWWWPPARRAPTNPRSRRPSRKPASTSTSFRWPTSGIRAPGCTDEPEAATEGPRTRSAWPWPRWPAAAVDRNSSAGYQGRPHYRRRRGRHGGRPGLADQGYGVPWWRKRIFWAAMPGSCDQYLGQRSGAAYVEDLVQAGDRPPQSSGHFQRRSRQGHGLRGQLCFHYPDPQGRETEVPHGVAIMAMGGHPYKPEEYLYGQNPNVLTAPLRSTSSLRPKTPR